MSGPYKDQAVSLQRDTLSLPWGFRLQGGKDFKAPLTIQRVFVGSPADGVVHRGDVLVSIENHDTTNMFHKQAQDIIKQAGGSLRMRVRRGSSYVAARPAPPPAPSVTPQGYRGPGSVPTAGALAFVPKPRPPMPASSKVPSFGQDYTRGNRYVPQKAPAAPSGNMLSRVQKSLDEAIWQPGAFEDDPDYAYRPVHDLRNNFVEQPYQPAHVPVDQLDEDEYEHVPVSELKKKFGKKQGKPRRSRKDRPDQIELPTEEDEDSRAGGMRTGKKWSPPDPSQFPGKPLYEPGWSPKQQQPQQYGQQQQQQQQPQQYGQQQQQGGWSPVKPPTMHGLPVPRSPQRAPAYVVPRLEEPDHPAWAGSLHSAGGVRPWEVAASRNAVTSNTMEVPQQQQRRRSPQPRASPQQQQQQPRTRSPRRRPQPEAVSPGSVQPHQPRVQAVSYGPGDVAPTYSQHGTDNYDGDAKIAHLQYNTPLGLYSRSNVEEALTGQTSGGAGAGTMQVTGGGPPGKKQFDPKQSSVLRLLQEQDSGARMSQPQAPAEQSARYMEHGQGQEMQYGGYMDHYKQSPSMHALECNMGSMSMEEPSGTSDF